MANIKLLYFASLADTLQCSEEILMLSNETDTISTLKKTLSERGAPWEAIMGDNINIAVNQHIQHQDQSLADGDEVAFFPPVTGG